MSSNPMTTANDGGAVDVLAVIDLHLAVDAKDQRNADLRRLRAAVAELIEASDDLLDVMSGYPFYSTARERLRAAINRCGVSV